LAAAFIVASGTLDYTPTLTAQCDVWFSALYKYSYLLTNSGIFMFKVCW